MGAFKSRVQTSSGKEYDNNHTHDLTYNKNGGENYGCKLHIPFQQIVASSSHCTLCIACVCMYDFLYIYKSHISISQ